MKAKSKQELTKATKASLIEHIGEVYRAFYELEAERDGLVIEVDSKSRKLTHEVARLNGIIDNYRAELVRMGAKE